MKISARQKYNGIKIFVEIEDAKIEESVENLFTNKVDKKLITELTDAAIECSRWNDTTDLEFIKSVVENYLTEKEIRELIKELEN